jgi:1-acyl-sn-glycerol-3-phosphate acyltransferase
VAIVDVNMPFGSMVVFIIKWALASVPAALILIVIFGVLYAILRAIFLH